MQKNIIALIKKDDCNEIEVLHERLLSLNCLALLFEDKKSEYGSNDDLYEKVIEDRFTTRKKFDCWWVFAKEKYALPQLGNQTFYVDFIDCCIYCVK